MCAVVASSNRKSVCDPLGLASTEFTTDDQGDPNGDADKFHTHCERQGRCFLGCLPAARHTLNKTLYSALLTNDKYSKDVTLWPLAEVRDVSRIAGGYSVSFLDHRADAVRSLSAKKVFLCGGTLGTTEV